MKLIFKILKPFRKILSYSLLLKALGAGVDLIIPWLIAKIISLAELPMTKDVINWIIIYSVLIIACATIGLVFNYISNRRSELISSQATSILRKDLFTHILSLDATAVDHLSTPSIISRMTSDTFNIYQSAAGLQRMAVRAPILLLTGIIMSMIISPLLSLIMIALLPLIVIISYRISKKGIIKYQEVQTNQDELIRDLRENINGARVIKALSTTQYEINRFNEVNSRAYQANLESTKTIAKTKPIMDIIMNLGLTATIFLGAILLYKKDMSVELTQLLTFVTNFTIILNAMLSITRIFSMISRATASATRINEILSTKSTINRSKALGVRKNNTTPFIEFRNVSFSYNGSVNNLSSINFTLNSQESLGIIGPTGAGKTTIINLLMRFYEFNEGNIFIYGENIRNLDINDWRSRVGLVLQNDVIFSSSYHYNVDFGRGITDEEYLNATKIAQADFISNDKDLNAKGRNLSGGQKQRLLIARAIASNPELIILDDCASALDYETEKKLRFEIEQKLSTSTKIIISSRVASIMHCNKIIVIEDGNISAIGTHEELIRNNLYYQTLSSIQLDTIIGLPEVKIL